MINPSNAATILAPTEDTSATTVGRSPIRLAGSGTAESHNQVPLAVNRMATFMVGEADVRVTFAAEPGRTDQVESTSLRVPAGSSMSWVVDKLTEYLYVEAADGSSAYEVWVWKSS